MIGRVRRHKSIQSTAMFVHDVHEVRNFLVVTRTIPLENILEQFHRNLIGENDGQCRTNCKNPQPFPAPFSLGKNGNYQVQRNPGKLVADEFHKNIQRRVMKAVECQKKRTVNRLQPFDHETGFSDFQMASFSSVNPSWLTDEKYRCGKSPSEADISFFNSSSSISDLEIAIMRSLSSNSGLNCSSSFNKIRYSSAMSSASAGSKNNNTLFRSMWRRNRRPIPFPLCAPSIIPGISAITNE